MGLETLLEAAKYLEYRAEVEARVAETKEKPTYSQSESLGPAGSSPPGISTTWEQLRQMETISVIDKKPSHVRKLCFESLESGGSHGEVVGKMGTQCGEFDEKMLTPYLKRQIDYLDTLASKRATFIQMKEMIEDFKRECED